MPSLREVGNEFGDPPARELDFLDVLFDHIARDAGDVRHGNHSLFAVAIGSDELTANR